MNLFQKAEGRRQKEKSGFNKCLLQMVGTLHATSVGKKEEARRNRR
ncbi:MAG: hypothetical protein F6K17_19165 [Okeania sp. SIO3C4]|nr:hypothetical protein [Okeania sp. SIO3B3]NER04576.1 hypothetical protein [Okeania sp. SIO3C4]